MTKKDFYTDGMTVEEILNLGDDQIRALSKRDISHALRTVSLAANKRVNRLLDNAIKRGGQYVEKKSAKKAIALDALNKLADESDGNLKFSGKGKTRNQMIAELGRARSFMEMKTSTIKGAESVRKMRESRALGKTREDVMKEAAENYRKEYKQRTGKAPTKKQVKEVQVKSFKEFQKLNSEIWSRFRKFNEMNNKTGKYAGSDEILDMIANRSVNGADEGETLAAAAKLYERQYIEHMQEEFYDMADYDEFMDEDDFDFGENF